jgi:hypothetical protein
MVKVIICIRRSKEKDEEIELETDFRFNTGDIITFPDRIRKTNSYHAIEITEIKIELREGSFKKELIILVGAKEHF